MFNPRRSLFWFLLVLLIMSAVVTGVYSANARASALDGPTLALQEGGDSAPPISPGIPSAIAIGAVISFLFDNLPLLKDWFDSTSSTVQKWIIIVACALAGIGIFVATDPPGVFQSMTIMLWLLLAQNVIVAIGSSQVWYKGPGKTLQADSDVGRG